MTRIEPGKEYPDMRVILTEEEILIAIEDFVLDSVKVPKDVRIDIDLKATRGDEGYTAIIDLVSITSSPVAERIEPTEEATQEGLGIVDKINAAKAQGDAPRRRGRPAANPKPAVPENVPVEAQAQLEEVAVDLSQEEPDVEDTETTTDVNEGDATEEEQLAAEALATEPAETVEETPTAEAVEEAAATSENAPKKSSLFGTKVPVGQAAQPQVEVQPEPTPEPQPVAEAAEAEAAPAPAPKTKSLFANLTKPVNTKAPDTAAS
jgi:hypothetical protein